MSGQDLAVVLMLSAAVTSTFLFAMSLWDDVVDRRAIGMSRSALRVPMIGVAPDGQAFAVYRFASADGAESFSQSAPRSGPVRWDGVAGLFTVHVYGLTGDGVQILAPTRRRAGR